ncbi:MAG TPA: 2Fe-2S iron-sulfur cluster-binding protein, partial [Candidatus Baltobacteraceae bacterium]
MSEALPRLPAPFGQSIDREREVSFSFEGRTYQGYAGDSVASALWANGVRVLSRSFKYKRPRGILSLTGLDGGALMQVGDEPNVPADRLLLAPDLPAITAQNYIGSFEHDRGALAGLFSRFLPVGFYYRAFFRPKGAWKFFERIIRQSGGLGRLRPDSSHPPQTDKQYLFCDVAVVGSGPAGIAAAAAAARRGADVLLIESEPRIGGSLLLGRAEECPQAADLLAEVQASPNVRILTSSLVQGLYADNWLAVESPARLYKVRARHVVAATGSFEQPLIFHNNDLPGVMLASAARRLLWLYGVAPGKRAVVGTVNDEGLATAVDLLDAGVEVELVADLRNAGARGPLHEYLAGRGVRVLMQTAIYEAVSKRAGLSGIFGAPVSAVRVAP